MLFSLMESSYLPIQTISGGLETGTVQLFCRLTRNSTRANTLLLFMVVKTAVMDHLMLDTREELETVSSH